MKPRNRARSVRLGDLLLEKKLITEQQLKQALDEQKRSGRKLGRVLIDIGAVVPRQICNACLATAAANSVRRPAPAHARPRRS